MLTPIDSPTYDELIAYQDHLDGEAIQSRTFTSLYKGVGLTGVALSSLALVTLPGWGSIALVGALAGYAGAVLSEARKTGKVMPLPFVGLGLETVMKSVANVRGGKADDGDDLTHYHYLDSHQKSDYALLLMMGTEVAQYLDALPTETAQRVAFTQIRRRFHQAYSAAVRDNPDMVAMGSDKQRMVEFIFADAEQMRRQATQIAKPLPPTPEALPPAQPPTIEAAAVEVPPTAAPVAAVAMPDPWVEPVVVSGDRAAHPLAAVTMPKAEIITAPDSSSGGSWDVVGHLAENLKSTLIIGVPGAGKGMLMSNLIRRIRAMYPELKIVGIDPKADPKETGYWSDGFDKVFRANNENMSDKDFVQWLKGCVDKFRMMPDGKILIWDEFTISCRKWSGFDKAGFREITNYIVSVGSTGDSRFNYIIAVGQISNAEDMGMSAGVRDIFKSVGIVSNEDRSKVDAFMRTSFTPNPEGGPNEIYRIMEKSPVGRAIFCWNRGQWEPMPRLENLSGYDRDTRQYIGEPLAEPVQLALPTEAPTPAVEPLTLGASPTPVVDAILANPKTDEFGASVLRWLKARGNGAEFTTSNAAASNWAAAAERGGKIADRKAATLTPVLEVLVAKGLLARVDEKTWRVTLS